MNEGGGSYLGEAALMELYAEGAAAFPDLALDADRFLRHLRRLESAAEPGALRAADIFLACACAEAVPGAVEAFDRALGGDIDATLRRVLSDGASVDDVRQLVRMRLFAHDCGGKIGSYSGHAPLGAWVRLVAMRLARNFLRQRRARHETPSDDALAKDVVGRHDIERDAMRSELLSIHKAAFEGALASLDPRDRTILRLYVVDRMTIDDLARVLRIHRATAARRVAVAREMLAQRTRASIIEQARLAPEELESALRLIESQLDASVERVLGPGEDADVG